MHAPYTHPRFDDSTTISLLRFFGDRVSFFEREMRMEFLNIHIHTSLSTSRSFSRSFSETPTISISPKSTPRHTASPRHAALTHHKVPTLPSPTVLLFATQPERHLPTPRKPAPFYLLQLDLHAPPHGSMDEDLPPTCRRRVSLCHPHYIHITPSHPPTPRATYRINPGRSLDTRHTSYHH